MEKWKNLGKDTTFFMIMQVFCQLFFVTFYKQIARHFKKILYICTRNVSTKHANTMAIMANNVQMQGVYVNVPAVDWSLFCELVRKFGWQAETREQLLDRFASSRPATPALTEEEIMDEVKAVRYAK